jgi:periodic tryptophan protein 1
MISAVKWVKRGIAARFPTHEMLDDENFDKINKLLAGQLENAKLNTMNNDHSNDDETNDNDINDDETNDDDGNDDDINEDDINDHDGNSSNDKSESNDIQIDANGQPIITENNVESIYNLSTYDKKLSEPQLFSSLKGLQYYKPDELDPYITLPDLDEDRDELEILETDNLILTAKTEEDVSYLEVYVYEPDNLYVHHDIMLPSFPLCLEWLDYAPDTNTPKNLVAIGTFDPQVEIWDLDVNVFLLLDNRTEFSSSYFGADSGIWGRL